MIANAVLTPRRRGVCPGLSAPMLTGDGLLVRLQPIGIIALDAFLALCAAARRDGNGIMEVTGRGSIQIRGLSAGSAPRFADSIAALGIAAADGVSVLANPLAGLDQAEILDSGKFAAQIRRAAAHAGLAARLAPKVSVVIDGGGTLDLDAVAADVRLHAGRADRAVVLHVSVGGDGVNAKQLGAVAPADGIEAVIRLLEVIARHGRAARARDVLATESGAAFRSAIDAPLISARRREGGDPLLDPRLRGNEQKMQHIAAYRLRDGSLACGIGLAFGHADSATLQQLVAAAGTAGAKGIGTASRTLLIVGLADRMMPAFMKDAARLSFIVDASDPRRRVTACAGAPACASGHFATRALAPAIADCVAPLPDTMFIHISGCGKGCAHAGKASLTVVGTPGGCALVAEGTVRDAPFVTVAADDLPVAVARYTRQRLREDSHV